ncbi:MAG: 2-C-methyl-D-erythritol 2,4-cyclodiphosphate synthase [Calditerrivibrio sp.]|nr:2-C-methyl-D-erythritol 2,4-cyclodiphosphate synthase [Calditerrivibrio sp.]
MKIKTGVGFDAHRFVEDRKLILGGVEIPYKYGLLGHSDADVVIHAIVDAIVGPALGKDIGNLFPDSDDRYKGIDSKILLRESRKMVLDMGYKISNIDVTVIAEKPKLKDYIPLMRSVLSEVLVLDLDDITIKATTTEKMGFTGREEGIAALAVATIVKF